MFVLFLRGHCVFSHQALIGTEYIGYGSIKVNDSALTTQPHIIVKVEK